MPAPLNVNLLLGLVAMVAVASTLLGTMALLFVTRRSRGRRLLATAGAHLPPVTVFKPLKGLDEELEENLRSFFRLDYPVYQLLFGVADENDPAIGVVRALLAEFPAQDATLVVGCPVFGLNPKVENLASMDRYRKHDVILISDSNVRVRPSYLRETACYLAEPGVGLVTNLFAGVGDAYSGATMENLQLNGFIAGGMALASVMRITCVVGKSMMMPVKVLEAIGGFARVRNLLAEDQVIGVLVRKAGYSIQVSHHVIENVNRRRGFNWFLNRHSRWYKIRRRMALATFMAEPMANLAVLGLVWAFSGESGIAWGGLAGLVGLGMVRDAVQTRLLCGRFPRLRRLLFSPIKDFLLLPLWFDAIVNSRVQWRGHRFHVGRLTRLREARVSRDVRRRVRRVRKLRSRRGGSDGHAPGAEGATPRNLSARFRFWSEPPRNPRNWKKLS
jgi:ceramide glucosyltransferase